MSNLRQDPLTGRWVIIAEGREGRPNEFRRSERSVTEDLTCPFCPGRESMTTLETAATGRDAGASANTSGWRTRVFPNLYPALKPDAEPSGSGPVAPESNLFRIQPGYGRHEVLVYSPRHEDSLSDLSIEHLAEVLVMIRDRCRDLARDPQLRYVLPFCNHGPAAGATLAHPHMQLIGTPEVPDLVRVKADRSADHRRLTGCCLLCDVMAAERRAAERVIGDDGDWLVWAPWASRSPWEMIATCGRHAADLRDLTREELFAGATVLSRALGALDRIFADPPLNLVVHSAPLARSSDNGYNAKRPATDFHWHLEIMPRLSRLAGFEAGTGFGINSVAPETAAHRLREEGSAS